MKYLHTMVRVSHLDSALEFYCDKLGLVELRRTEGPHRQPEFERLERSCELHAAVGIWTFLVFIIVSFSGLLISWPQVFGLNARPGGGRVPAVEVTDGRRLGATEAVIAAQRAASHTPNAAPFDVSVQSPNERTTAMARKPTTNPGTNFDSENDTAPDPLCSDFDFTCIHVRIGITKARKILRVSLVTVATRSTTSSPYTCLYVSADPTTCEVSCTAVPRNNPMVSDVGSTAWAR